MWSSKKLPLLHASEMLWPRTARRWHLTPYTELIDNWGGVIWKREIWGRWSTGSSRACLQQVLPISNMEHWLMWMPETGRCRTRRGKPMRSSWCRWTRSKRLTMPECLNISWNETQQMHSQLWEMSQSSWDSRKPRPPSSNPEDKGEESWTLSEDGSTGKIRLSISMLE